MILKAGEDYKNLTSSQFKVTVIDYFVQFALLYTIFSACKCTYQKIIFLW